MTKTNLTIKHNVWIGNILFRAHDVLKCSILPIFDLQAKKKYRAKDSEKGGFELFVCLDLVPFPARILSPNGCQMDWIIMMSCH